MNKELKVKIKEFTKKYFAYDQTDKKISDEVKQQLAQLGAFKPFYSDSEEERSIRLTDMLWSDNEKIKNIVSQEIQTYFSISNADEINHLLDQIKIYQNNLKSRIQKMKESKKNRKYE